MGDILSPTYEPETTAPAVMAGETPTIVASPTRPTPIVPAVVQELPMPSDTAVQMTNEAT